MTAVQALDVDVLQERGQGLLKQAWIKRRTLGVAAAALAALVPVGSGVQAGELGQVQDAFDTMFGTEFRSTPTYDTAFEKQLASVANSAQGRIGVAAMDLVTGQTVSVLGDQRFPMASTSKVAIAATFLQGVDEGKWSLDTIYPMMMPVRSAPFSSAVAPARPGPRMTARALLEASLIHSNNMATDGILKVVGGPAAVNAFMHRAGIEDFRLDRDILTLVRDDGAIDPASVIDKRDSATPLAMVRFLSGLYEGRWLSDNSRKTLFSIMDRCVTGRRRITAGLPAGVDLAHKTGTLHNVSSDIGVISSPEGHPIAVAIYVTGHGSHLGRDNRIAEIARTIYQGYQNQARNGYQTASR
ncbi:class A beta-lactamase [Novosphingobium sp. 9]|uniref:class A beta-lactamase n=1 Tax=Novosphingobium sp. 9 TaxID=2025349 RepID=UPI0021B594AF|nr:class A beta-lactamase [Novosphingobium sp. 9]